MPLVITTIVCVSANHFVSLIMEEELQLIVVSQGTGPLAGQLVTALSSQGASVRIVDTEEEVRDLVRDSNWTAGVIVGEGFDAQVEALELVDFLNVPEGRVIQGFGQFDVEIVSGPSRLLQNIFASELVQARLLEVIYGRMLERFPVVQAVVEASPPPPGDPGSDQPLLLQSRKILSSGALYLMLFPSQAVLFAFFLVSIMARSFISERSRGTLHRLRMAPLPGRVILLGKTIPFLLVSVVQGVLLFAAGRALFEMPVGGRPWMLLMIIFCTSLAATTLGLLVAVLVGTDYQVNVVVTFLILSMAGISGCLMPREFLPPMMKQLSFLITPHAWSLAAYEELLVNTAQDDSRILLSCLLLVILAMVYLSLSLWRMARAGSNMAS